MSSSIVEESWLTHESSEKTRNPATSSDVKIADLPSVVLDVEKLPENRCCSSPPSDERRRLGAYYTPEDLAMVLTNWAIRGSTTKVIDPSFGGGVFLGAAVRSFRELGHGGAVYGVDVDVECLKAIDGRLSIPPGNLVVGDFLSIVAAELPGCPYDAVLGNPPYVRHHWLKGEVRAAARRVVEEAEVDIPATASLWVYFVLRAIQVLAPDGRFAMILPEAILQADYAVPVRKLLQRRFCTTRMIHIGERQFMGTDESVVAVVAHGTGPGELRVETASTIAELHEVLRGRHPLQHRSIVTGNGRRVSRTALAVLQDTIEEANVVRFGDHAITRIGFVTGANHFFVRRASDIVRLGLPAASVQPVIGRTRWLEGAVFCANDHARWALDGGAAFLVRPSPNQFKVKGVRRWIAEGIEEGLPKRHKCSIRPDWAVVPLGEIPDAFASSTRQGAPRLALNPDGLHCSNTLFSIRWKEKSTTLSNAIVLGFHTSLSALWAELNGRRYGGGVLKLDPGALGNMPVPIAPTPPEVFRKFDGLLRAGNESEARLFADNHVLVGHLNMNSDDVQCLRDARRSLQEQRTPRRREACNG